MELFVQILIGLALATACGFRVFVPLWAISLFSLTGYIELADSFSWMGTIPAFIVFTVALIFEIAIYYLPFLDNFVDIVATPVAVIAGAVVMSSFVDGIDPLIKYTLLLIASSSLSLIIKLYMSGIRAFTSTFSGGTANMFVSTVEGIASIFLSVGAVLLPILSVLFVIPVFLFAKRSIRKMRMKSRQVKATH